MDARELVATKMLSMATGCSESTIKFWSNRGELPPSFRVAGRRAWPPEAMPSLIQRVAELKSRRNGRRMSAAV
jgi:DNA-binding transcriptional MerR regulator